MERDSAVSDAGRFAAGALPFDGGFRRAGGAEWHENGWFDHHVKAGLTAVSEAVYMRKVGVRDVNYPLTKFYVRWVRFCV